MMKPFWVMVTLLKQMLRPKKRQLRMMVTLSLKLKKKQTRMTVTLMKLSLKHMTTVTLAKLRLKLTKTKWRRKVTLRKLSLRATNRPNPLMWNLYLNPLRPLSLTKLAEKTRTKKSNRKK